MTVLVHIVVTVPVPVGGLVLMPVLVGGPVFVATASPIVIGFVEQAELDLASDVPRVRVQDQGTDVAADVEDRILEREARPASGVWHRITSSAGIRRWPSPGFSLRRATRSGVGGCSMCRGDPTRMSSDRRIAPGDGPRRPRLPWQVAFVVLASIWGCSFLFIKLGLEGLNPIQVAFWRVAIGAITLVILLTLKGRVCHGHVRPGVTSWSWRS